MTSDRVIAFDLMDTLLKDPYREALEAATGLTLRELFDRRPPSLYPAFERGELSEDAYWQGFVDAGIDIDADAFHRTRRAGYRWLAGMQGLLQEVSDEHRCVVASNYPDWIVEVRDQFLDGAVDAVYASYDLGARKPEPAFYERLAGREGVTAGHIVFVDDRERNVSAARDAGMDGILFTEAEQLRADLVARGLLD